MIKFEEQGKSVGVIFDLSIRHTDDGRRIIDVVKKSFSSIFREFSENNVDNVYLYQHDDLTFKTLHGEISAMIGNYKSDGESFDVSDALKQTLFLLHNTGDHFERKYLFLVTDRISSIKPLIKIVSLNRNFGLDAKIVIFGIGEKYIRSELESFASTDPEVKLIHVNQPQLLTLQFFKESINDGE